MLPRVAVTVVVPGVKAVARPEVSIDSTPRGAVDQVAEMVMFFVVLLLYVPVAVYCKAPPMKIVTFGGVTAIDNSTGATPFPLKLTVCGLLAALSVMVSFPV